MAKIILEMDPGIIVTLFDDLKGLAGPTRAELLALSETAPGHPLSVRTGVTLMFNAGGPSMEQRGAPAIPSGHCQEKTKVFSVRRSVDKYFKRHQPDSVHIEKLPHVKFYNAV